jgi:hypothetical protein
MRDKKEELTAPVNAMTRPMFGIRAEQATVNGKSKNLT